MTVFLASPVNADTAFLPDRIVFKRPPDHGFGLLTNFFSGPVLFSYFCGRDGCEHLDHQPLFSQTQ